MVRGAGCRNARASTRTRNRTVEERVRARHVGARVQHNRGGPRRAGECDRKLRKQRRTHNFTRRWCSPPDDQRRVVGAEQRRERRAALEVLERELAVWHDVVSWLVGWLVGWLACWFACLFAKGSDGARVHLARVHLARVAAAVSLPAARSRSSRRRLPAAPWRPRDPSPIMSQWQNHARAHPRTSATACGDTRVICARTVRLARSTPYFC